MSVKTKASINEIQDEIIEEFEMFHDKMGKYEYLIDLGKDLDGLDDDLKIEENRVKGCQSRVWFHAEKQNGVIHFQAESDAFIVSGIISILLRIYSDQKADDIINSDTHFIDEIGLNKLLSPTRANGLASMLKQIKYYAVAFNHKD